MNETPSSSKKPYLAAGLWTLVALGIFAGLFQIWRDRTQPERTISQLSQIEDMEKNGVADFKGQLMDGSWFETKSIKGPVIIINFWASWCGPCVQEVPSLVSLVRAMNGSLELVAVSEDNSKEDVQAFMKAFSGLNDPHIHVIYDEDRSLMKKFGSERLPESFLLNPQRKLVKKIVGGIEWHTPDSEAYIREILAGH